MRTLHAIISQFAKDETRVEISRRDLVKIKNELRRPVPRTVTKVQSGLMNTRRLGHESKMYWPTVYSREVPKGQGEVRSTLSAEHPMITARKRQHPAAKIQGRRTR